MNPIDILETNPSTFAFIAFVVALLAWVFTFVVDRNSKLMSNSLTEANRLAHKSLEGPSENETTKPFLDVLLEQVRNNSELLKQNKTQLDQNQAMIALEAERFQIIKTELSIAHDERAAITIAARQTQDSTLQIFATVSEIEKTTKGGQTMIEQVLERVIGLEQKIELILGMLQEKTFPSKPEQKDLLTREVLSLQSEAAKVEAEVKEVIGTEKG